MDSKPNTSPLRDLPEEVRLSEHGSLFDANGLDLAMEEPTDEDELTSWGYALVANGLWRRTSTSPSI
jgi:hypothetical protein